MNHTVLIVDDSLTVRMDLAEAFSAAVFTPLLCGTVAEARERLAGDPIDVVILDVLLPDGDGIELLKEVRASPSASAMVLMLSMEADIKDRILGLQTGADEYVGKPYDASYVVTKARAFLRSRRSETAAENATILVIDDSLTFREELREACEDAGYQVLIAASGEEGLRIAADHRPSAMIVDGMLPGIDGATVIRRVRVDAALRGVPCLLLTASEDHKEELRALDAGADAFVRKDEALTVILARLGAILRSGQSHPDDRAIASLQGLKKVLAVDDSETFLQELAEALRTEGYEVVLARSGEEALELLSVQSVDCILLDLIMPKMSGQEVCRRIKSDPAMRNIPVLMLTARDDQEAIIEGLGAGADDYITKANDFQVLRARVLAQIRRKQFEDENRRIREQMLHRELEATEARAARELAETRAVLADELARKNEELAAAKAQLEDYARTLEDRVRERSDQLVKMEQQLRQSQKMDAVGQLTGGIAHDFNNLLTVVIGTTATLANEVDDPRHRRMAELILRAAKQGGELTKQLLAFARRQPLAPRAFDVRTLLENNAALIQRTLGSDLQFSIASASDVPRVFADLAQTEAAILNLCLNARDAMPGGGKLTITTEHVTLSEGQIAVESGAQAGDYGAIRVSDTGTGIAPEVIDRIFEPFFTTKETGKGTGLGLSMVYGFAKQSGGFVDLTSELGKGTTFTIYLPLADEDAAEIDPKVDGEGAIEGGSENVLIVEDNDMVREHARGEFESLGYQVTMASTGAEALAILERRDDVDLLFTDIVMPGGMNGRQLAEIAVARCPWLRVLYTSGYSEDALTSDGRLTEGVTLLAKPYSKRELSQKVRKVLEEVM